MLHFDFPLTERVRNYIRVEQLFDRFNEALAGDDKWMHHAAIYTLFELVECASKAELKRDMLQELERQRLQQNASGTPDSARLEKLNQAIQELQTLNTHSAQNLRENEWLTAFKQRLNIVGSNTAVELPSYHFWLNQTAAERREYLRKWSATALPIQNAVGLVLETLRSNPQVIDCQAISGKYEHGGLVQTTQLLSVEIDPTFGVVPDVSANKYFTNISFLLANQESTRSKVSEQDLPFKLILCSVDNSK